MRIVHIITDLEKGGAENSLYKICKYDKSNEHIVISIKSLGDYNLLLKKIGVKLYDMNIKFYSFFKFIYLINLIRLLKPDIVQTWLPQGDFVGGIASKLSGINRIVWNIRYSKLDRHAVKLRTIILIKILSKLSFIIPKIIIVVSKSALKNCKDIGYCIDKLKLIQNGFDASIIKLDKKKYKIKKKIPIIGSIARFDPTKDHENLLKALSIVQKKNINFICHLIGRNIDKNNKLLVNQIKKLELSTCVKLLGKSNDVLKSMRALDIHILSSRTEGFPNVVAEAMILGIPCIVTDVGDSAFIVGKTGWVVQPKNPVKLANAIKKALSSIGKKGWKRRCNQAQLRIKNNFEISKMIKLYNMTWSAVFNKN
jgi:glycosyltransferase involved in cell wall biosynthesis